MLFAPGSRVRFVHTGYEGVVAELIDDQMVSVLLDDGDEIPAFVDDLIRIEDYRKALSNKLPVKAKIVKGKSPKQEEPPEFPEQPTQYGILKSLGIQLAFEPKTRLDGTTEHYKIYLINDTHYDVLYSFSMQLDGVVKLKNNSKLSAVSTETLGELHFDHLNQAPLIQVEVWQVTTQGTGKKLSKSLKIKAQQFFKRLRMAPLLQMPAHHYILFDTFEATKTVDEDLQTYTKKNAVPIRKGKLHNSKSVEALANFNPELDLHITKLVDNLKGMSKADILRVQLQHFDRFLEEAINLGVPRVFIIHGLGKGRLRNEIASRVIKHPSVRTFKNDFHPNYGYGATEIILN